MRASPILTALFPAVRQEILTATLLSPERSWYLSELAAHLKTSPSSLQRELEALAASGILQRRQEGSRTYYRAETASPSSRNSATCFRKRQWMVGSWGLEPQTSTVSAPRCEKHSLARHSRKPHRRINP